MQHLPDTIIVNKNQHRKPNVHSLYDPAHKAAHNTNQAPPINPTKLNTIVVIPPPPMRVTRSAADLVPEAAAELPGLLDPVLAAPVDVLGGVGVKTPPEGNCAKQSLAAFEAASAVGGSAAYQSSNFQKLYTDTGRAANHI